MSHSRCLALLALIAAPHVFAQSQEGLLDEVCVYQRALPRAEIKAELVRLKDVFGVNESPEAAAAERRETRLQAFTKTQEDWAKGDFAAVRTACAALAASADAPPSLRSYAHLRTAQSYQAEGKPLLARAQYVTIAATAAYPEVHRTEARECVAEIDRVTRGLPARDPAASRTKITRPATFVSELFVSPSGDDNNSGTATSPLATLARARDVVRARRERGLKGALAINIRPGEYRVTTPLKLTNEDSGTPTGPVVYRATEPGKAVLYGGGRVTGFETVTDPAIPRRLPSA